MTTEEVRPEGRKRIASAQFETARFLGLSLLVGVLVGAGAALLIWAVEWVGSGSTWLEDGTSLGRLAILVSVPVGLLIAWWSAPKLRQKLPGTGFPKQLSGWPSTPGICPPARSPSRSWRPR